ncbi:unnamed protein product [Gongylonema pulchrum]|uniref:ZnF_CDGSH domain-containing protein n=1 Tax=Gongylonema pulchrum TaxID=637853 RepID=A0A183DW56_9BILA|nr:unnamed protein product [Gongylonema pulchrum]
MVAGSLVRHLTATLKRASGKSGWGPYRNLRRGEHFVGTEPPPLKYHVLQDKKPLHKYGLQGTHHLLPGTGKLQDKKPLHKYGLQGTHHLLPGTGKVSATLPTRAVLKKDKIYAWCSCGYSGNQTKTRPFCDGSHREVKLRKAAEENEEK